MPKCPLCSAQAQNFKQIHNRHYNKCTNCESVFLDPADYISPAAEQARYEEHNNDVEDPGYQKFVEPLVQKVVNNFKPENSLGLDFGAGTGPVITKLLQDKGYTLNLYDPFFHNHPQVLTRKYDYIVSCEVIEHFHNPYQEFQLLKSLLKPSGILVCKTDPYTSEIDFQKWYYKDDPTHVFFYTNNAFQWLKNEFHFTKLELDGRLITFTNQPIDKMVIR